MPAALICGSLAYDTIMVFQDQFKNHILPDKVHILNVSFLVPEDAPRIRRLRRQHRLQPVPARRQALADGHRRRGLRALPRHFEQLGISLAHVKEIAGLFTAQAFITTDLDDNQITAFHPGAMMRSYENHVGDVPDVGFGIVGPDGYEAMLQNSRDFANADIPFIFDPGQAMPLFNGAELSQMIEQATYVTVNDYESSLLQERTGWNEKQIAERVQGYLITRGPAGSEIHTKSGMVQIPAANAMRVVDPTGCGDAYRAGLIYGLMNGMDFATTGRIASLMGALKIESLGPQNHRFSLEQFAEQFRQQFGYALR
jgi:adenosine kinase